MLSVKTVGRKTLSQAKNDIRACLQEAVDPPLDDGSKSKIRAHFNDSCAYCGRSMGIGSGEFDHLVPRAKSALNHISNRVLSCRTCNGNEKRDKDWEGFIREKRSGEDVEHASAVIRAWTSQHALPPRDEALLRQKKAQADQLPTEVAAALDEAYRRLRPR